MGTKKLGYGKGTRGGKKEKRRKGGEEVKSKGGEEGRKRR